MEITSIDLNQKYIRIMQTSLNKDLLLKNINILKKNIKIQKNINIFNNWINILKEYKIKSDKIIINLGGFSIESFTINMLIKKMSNEYISLYLKKKILACNIDFINFSCYEKKITKTFLNIINFNNIKKSCRINAMYNNEIFFYKKLLNKFNISQFFISFKTLSLINIIDLIDNKIKNKLFFHNKYLYIINIESLEINICICNNNKIIYNISLLKIMNITKNKILIINEIYQSLLNSKINNSFSFILTGNIKKCIILKNILVKAFKKNTYLFDSFKLKVFDNINFSAFSCMLGSILELNNNNKFPILKIKRMNKVTNKKNINIFFLFVTLFILLIFLMVFNKNFFFKDYIYQIELLNLLIFKYI